MTDRLVTTLGDLLRRDGGSIKTGPFGTTLKAAEYSEEGVPLISVGEVGHGHLRVRVDTPRAPKKVVERLPEYVLEEGDIVFGRKGAVDRSAWVKPEQAGWFLGSDGVRLRLPLTCDSRFVAYQLQAVSTRTWIRQHATGTTMASLNQTILGRLPIVVPPLIEQRGIAGTLAALDDKIESNRRTIDISSELLDATSSSFALDVDSVPLSYLADPLREAFDPTSLGTELIDHFSIPAFDAQGLPDRTTGAAVISAKLRVDQPAILVSRLNPKTNRTWFAVPESGVTAGCSTEFLVLAPKAGVTLGSLWLAVRDEGFRSLIAQRVTGTSGSHQRVKPQDALSTEVPDVRQLPAGDFPAADELLWLMHQRRIESNRLATLRDALLPELLSGRIRVPEAGEAVESALT